MFPLSIKYIPSAFMVSSTLSPRWSSVPPSFEIDQPKRRYPCSYRIAASMVSVSFDSAKSECTTGSAFVVEIIRKTYGIGFAHTARGNNRGFPYRRLNPRIVACSVACSPANVHGNLQSHRKHQAHRISEPSALVHRI